MNALRGLFSWLNPEPETIRIFLMPADAEARTIPGFRTGGLPLIARSGETLGAIMARFNQFRGPDSQIRTLYTQDGALIPYTTVMTGPATCVVRKV
jgi:hypothetical protein